MRLILIFIIAFAGFAHAETAEQLRERILAKPGVVACNWAESDQPRSLPFHNLHYGVLVWYYLDSDAVFQKASGEVLVSGKGTQSEAAHWAYKRPAIDTPVVVEKFITDRTGGGFTESEVKASVQAIWANAAPGTGAIIGLNISKVDGKTIRATGSFDNGSGGREQRTYLLWLADVNGSVTPGNANIKWQRETVANNIGAQAMADYGEKYASYYKPGYGAWENYLNPSQTTQPSEPNDPVYDDTYAGIIPGHPLAW